ncbi:uncharacterized protein LOC143185665 isoform X2 [Calliopsis andreniformis]
MTAVYPTLPKLTVRDGFDDEDLTDIDDEVFIRDGKNGLKLDDDGGVKRPLMAPRRKYKKSYSFETYKFSHRTFYVPFCFGLTALVILLSLITLCIYIVNIIPMPMSILKNWLSHDLKDTLNDSNIVPCTSISRKILWTRSLPKLTSESPLRSNDVDGDGIEDIIVGFSTGLDMIDTPEYICTLYFEGQNPCFGGVLALNGKTGDTIWTHWTAHTIFSVNCGLDLTNDKIRDCIICGRGGILHAINGHDGSSIWEIPIQELTASEEWKFSNIYDAKFISDIDGDEIGDVIASHTIQSREIHTSEILIISGSNGNILHRSALPNTEQLFLAPQKIVHPDGESIFVLVTSSQKQSGGLYVVPQVDLMYGNLKLRKLHHDTGKGTVLPPILVDITLDGVEDIVATMFNSTIIVYNGLTFEPIWNYTIPNSEVISVPIPGYYNNDNIPDFMVKHQIGSGYPTYYYTVATIIDGKTGKSLLEKPIEDSLSRQMSGLSVTVEDFGNDWFLYWSVDCLNYEGIKEKYQFLKSEDLLSESRVDLCKLRFNSTLTTNLYALSQHVGPPGLSLYFSEDWKSLEFNNSVTSKVDSYGSIPFMSERSPKIYKNQVKEDTFKQQLENELNIMDSKPFREYESSKKLANPNFQNDDADTFSNDYTWKNENKWTHKNVQTDKDYDVSYDGNSNSNAVQQSMDYSQADEVREQRSNMNDKFINHLYKNINNFTNSGRTNQLNIINETHNFEQLTDYLLNKESNKESDTKIMKLKKRAVGILQSSINDTKGTIEQISTEKFLINTTTNIPSSNSNKSTEFQKKDKKTITKEPKVIKKLSSKFKTGLKERKEKREIKTDSSQIYQAFGVQKQPPTGILLPSISVSKGVTSVDLIFSTYWLPSSEVPIILIQEDLDCIHRKKVLSEKRLQYKQNDEIIKECLAERGIDYKIYQEATDRENFKISLGQMTIYRMKLECVCPEDMLPNQSCKNISSEQSWSEYLGSHGNGYFKPLHKTNF